MRYTVFFPPKHSDVPPSLAFYLRESLVVIQCAAFETIKVNRVRYIAADKEQKDTTLYSGPVFDYLDDELQDAFYSYLSDRKIDDDLAHFITSYAVEKEQNEYAIWLRQLANFTSE